MHVAETINHYNNIMRAAIHVTYEAYVCVCVLTSAVHWNLPSNWIRIELDCLLCTIYTLNVSDVTSVYEYIEFPLFKSVSVASLSH